MKDGWNKIFGYDVYVENNRAIRALEHNRTLYPYRLTMNGYTNCSGITISALKSAWYRGTIIWK